MTHFRFSLKKFMLVLILGVAAFVLRNLSEKETESIGSAPVNETNKFIAEVHASDCTSCGVTCGGTAASAGSTK